MPDLFFCIIGVKIMEQNFCSLIFFTKPPLTDKTYDFAWCFIHNKARLVACIVVTDVFPS